MAEQSAFLTAFDEMQKKKGGFNAPAPLESVVDTVGQAPAVQSPFSQQAAAATAPLAAPIDLSAAPAVQAPQELTADSLGPVAFPGLQQQGMDTRLQASSEEQQRMNEMSKTLSDGQIQKEREGSTVGGFVENAAKKGFDYFFGAPTAEQAQNTLDTMPTDPDQRARLQATAAGEGVPSDLSKAASFFFGRPEVAGDPNTLGAQAPAVVSDDPFGVTPEEIAAAGNENFGKAVAENPYRSQYGVNSLEQGAVDEIQQQDAAAPQAQLPSTIQNAGGQNLAGFKPKYEGQSLTDYMAGRDDPSAASVQVQDPQGRFRRQAASVAGETPEQNQARTDALFPEQADFQQKSADREARQAARPDFGEAVSDRDRRAARGEGMSDADRRDIAKANQRGASAGDVARGDKVAEANGIDRKTGKPLEGDGLTVEQQLAIRKQQFIESEAARKAKVENAGLVLTPGEKKIDEDVASDLNDWRLNGSSLAKSNIIQLSEVIGDLEDGNIDTRSLSDFAPMSDNVRALFNPTGQDALDKVRGVIFQSLKATLGGQFAEKEGVRLVNAAYNTQLSEEQNIDRLGALLRRTQAAADAKDNASQYFQENGTLKGYSGVGARSAFDASTGAQGAKGSPIKGDVDVAGEADSRLNNY